MIDQGTIIRGAILFGFLQWIIPSRKFEKNHWQFMASNLGVVLVNNVMIAILLLIPYQVAVIAKENGIGLLSNIDGKILIIGIIAIQIVILDFTIYFQHRMFHRINFLWRFYAI